MQKSMKNILKITTVLLGAAVLATGCIKEINPQTNVATQDQVAAAPGAFDNYVNAITATMCGTYQFGSNYAYDLGGYPSFMTHWACIGQDVIPGGHGSSWMSTWYGSGTGLGPQYLVCQLPWTYYYSWISNCNRVLSLTGENPAESQKVGAGIAYAMRAFYYMDLARMFAPETYASNLEAITVPIVTEKTLDLANNPRATNEAMWQFIIDDLNKAEEFLADYDRGTDKTKPDVSFVYGLKARAYLTMEKFAEAETYAKKAQEGYTMLTEAQYLDHFTAFNTPNDAWMFCVTYKADDPAVLENDSDSNWGSQWFTECGASGCLYASNYGDPKYIDAHLFETIPATDFRKKCWVDPAVDELGTEEEVLDFLATYTNYGESLVTSASAATAGVIGHMQLKFRAGGGEAGRSDNYKATVVSVPLMRVEEMMLIEAEAVGMQSGREAEGKNLLLAFAQQRDPEYQYNDLWTLRENIWWQRRVEFWGESALATFDIKRLNKGITRSYAGTNHPESYRWNTTGVPQWFHLCIVQTETNYNLACVNNPTPIAPTEDSPEHVW